MHSYVIKYEEKQTIINTKFIMEISPAQGVGGRGCPESASGCR